MSFLNNQTQRVVAQKVISGLTQESVFGTNGVIYINDLPVNTT